VNVVQFAIRKAEQDESDELTFAPLPFDRFGRAGCAIRFDTKMPVVLAEEPLDVLIFN